MNILDLNNYANNVALNTDNSIWHSKTKRKVSYPNNGNDDNFEIEDNSFWFQHRNNCIIASVKKYCPNEILFDVGGGNGFVSKGLEDSGITTVLVEPGNGVINAKRRGLKNILNSTLEDAKFKKLSLSAIGVFDVIEHIPNDIEFLQSLFAYMKESGLLFITVPAYSFLWSNDDKFAGHYRRYTLKSIKKKLTDIGFNIKYSTYFFSFLPLPVFFLRTIPSIIKKKEQVAFNKNIIEHNKGKGLFIQKVLKTELIAINSKRSIPFGSSCLVIASKNFK